MKIQKQPTAALRKRRNALLRRLPPFSSDPARFSHRALQTMRQAGLQMRRGPRPWAQILFVGQLSGVAAANGLRTAGILRANGGVPVELPPSPRDLRDDLRDQPRVASPSRGALEDRHEGKERE